MNDAAANGPCRGGDVLVVVDLQRLEPEATPSAACAGVDTRADGIDALTAAGFEVTGTARFGRSFACRIDDRPAASERLAIPGRGDRRETCADTPPTTAYWSYWTAAPGTCAWTYSQAGATTGRVEAGSAQGWSFTLGAPTGDAPEPRIGPCDTSISVRDRSPLAATDAAAAHDTSAARIDPLVALGLLGLFALVGIVAARRRRRRGHGGADA